MLESADRIMKQLLWMVFHMFTRLSGDMGYALKKKNNPKTLNQISGNKPHNILDKEYTGWN